MKAKNKKILIIGIIVVALIGIGIGLLFYFNDGYTYTPDGQASNPNYYSDEIPFLEGVKMGMSYDQVRRITYRQIGHVEESEYDENYGHDYYYIDSKDYAYSITEYYRVYKSIPTGRYSDERFSIYYLFSNNKLVSVDIYSPSGDYANYSKLVDLYYNPNYIENKIFGDKTSYWYTDTMIIRCRNKNNCDISIDDVDYDFDKVTIKENLKN